MIINHIRVNTCAISMTKVLLIIRLALLFLSLPATIAKDQFDNKELDYMKY
jgi:hypothetical protein